MEIFESTDEELCLALLCAGAKLAGSDTGDVPPCINHYTPDTCRSRRLLPNSPVTPQAFEKSVIEARGKPVFTIRDPNEPKAEALISRLGFKYLDEIDGDAVYLWSPA